jgi:hypothetical protein
MYFTISRFNVIDDADEPNATNSSARSRSTQRPRVGCRVGQFVRDEFDDVDKAGKIEPSP